MKQYLVVCCDTCFHEKCLPTGSDSICEVCYGEQIRTGVMYPYFETKRYIPWAKCMRCVVWPGGDICIKCLGEYMMGGSLGQYVEFNI